MVKKIIRPFLPLVLLLSSKAFCNQDLNLKDMALNDEVNLIKTSDNMPNAEEVLRNCCKEKCKKCKCKKFCKLLVSKKLKTESLEVVKNATIGGTLAVTGSTTIMGAYPVLNSAEQVYSLRGHLAPSSKLTVTLTLGTAPSNNPTVYPITVAIDKSAVRYTGQGFTVSDISGTGYYYSDLFGTGTLANTVVNFSATVTFDTAFKSSPSIALTDMSDIAIRDIISGLNGGGANDIFLNYLNVFASEVSATGFKVNLTAEIFSGFVAPAALPDTIAPLLKILLENATISFIVAGVAS